MFTHKILFFIFLLLYPLFLEAVTRNANPGNLQSQCQAMQNGDTLVLASGTYTGGPCIFTDDDNQHNVTVQVATGANVTFDNICFGADGANGVHFTGQAGTWRITNVDSSCEVGIQLAESSDNLLEYIEIDHIDGQGILGTGNNNTFRHMNIHHIAVADSGQPYCHIYNPCVGNPCDNVSGTKCHAWYTGGDNHIIEDSIAHHTDGSIIHGAGEVALHNIIVRGNHFHDAVGQNVWLLRSPQNFKVYNNILGPSAINGGGFGSIHVTGGNGLVAHNTFYGGGGHPAIYVQGSSQDIINNIITGNWDGNIADDGSGSTIDNNLCGSSGSGCEIVGNPTNIFANYNGGDYHLKEGSPAINAGVTLAGVPVDKEGNARVGASDIGAYEFGGVVEPPPDPDPEELVAHYTGNNTFNDSSGNNFHLTSNGGMTATGTGLFATNSFSLDGIDDYASLTPLPAALKPTGEICLSGWIKSTDVDDGVMIGLGGGAALRFGGGVGIFSVNFASTSVTVGTTSTLLTNGSGHHLVGTYDGTSARVYFDDAEQGFAAASGAIVYPSDILTIGRRAASSEAFVSGLLADLRIYNFNCTPTAVHNLYTGQIALGPIEVTGMAWMRPNSPTVDQLGAINTDRSVRIDESISIRYRIQNNSSLVTQHYPLECCNVTNCESPSDWILVADAPNAVGVDFGQDTESALGDPTGELGTFPSAGFAFIPGVYVTSPYDTNDQTELDTGEATEWEYGPLLFSSPLVATSQIQCRPRITGGVYSNIKTLTLTAAPIPSVENSSKSGGASGKGVVVK